MAVNQETLTDGSVLILLDDMDDWDSFASDNREALVDQYGSVGNAFAHATQGGLLLGGGAAPEIGVYFKD